MKFIALALIFSLSLTCTVFAQTIDDKEKKEDKEHIRNQYKPASYENFLKLYFRDSKLSTQDSNDLDYYIINSQCELAEELIKDDFKWKVIRDNTASYIRSARNTFSNKFYFVQPLMLGDYNFEEKGFNILDDYIYSDVRRIRISHNAKNDLRGECRRLLPTKGTSLEKAPLNVVANLYTPFSIRTAEANKEISELYLDYLKLHKEFGSARPAYIAFYMTLTNYMKDERDPTAPTGVVAEYKTTLDFIEIYADKEREYPLYFKRFGK